MTFIRYEYADGLARITLADGERGNPLHIASAAELFGAVRQASSDRARVILLRAEGRFFSVGGDLAAFAEAPDRSAYIDDLAESLHRVVSELQRSQAIVVAAVQGHAAGAGFPLAAAADVLVAAENVRFSFGYNRVGLSPDGGSTLLTRTLGLHRTLRLALLGEPLEAQEAHEAGLVAAVVAGHRLEAHVDEVVRTLLELPTQAQAETKRLIRQHVTADLEAALRDETLGIRAHAGTGDGEEGIGAFLEKRKPRFEQAR